MRSPSEYSTVPFSGCHIMEVDAGTVITDERSGEKITVDDSTVAMKGNVMFCTAKVFERLKQEVPSRSAAPLDKGGE